MTRRDRLILLVAGLATLGLVAFLSISSGDSVVGTRVASARAATGAWASPGAATIESVSRSPALPGRALPLPPPDAPLETAFDDLAKAADAGDVAAACRLAWDLQRCHRLQAQAAIPEFLVEGAARAPQGSPEEGELIAEVMAARERLAGDRRVCAGLSADRLEQAAERMLQAARLGHPASQAMFASWPPFGPDLSLEEAELAIHHRDHAMALLRTAAASGEPAALFGLFHACHFGEIRMLHGTVDVGRDPVCAMATALALRGFADRQTAADAGEVIRESVAILDMEDQQRARRRAAFYRARFEGLPEYDFAGGVFKPHLRAPCSDLAMEHP